jgi:phage gp37-like protein
MESVNDTLKGQLDLERHGGSTDEGVVTRVLQRLPALTVAIWYNAEPASRRSAPWLSTVTAEPLESFV